MMSSRVFAQYRARMQRLKAKEDGTTALEFAMVAGPFFFLLFGLLEICIVFIVSTVMEQAAGDAARAIRTGAFTGTTGTPLKDDICSGMIGLFDCANSLRVQVDSPTSFGTVPALDFTDGDGSFKAQDDIAFDTGDGGDIVVVRVFFEWELITPVIARPLSNFNDNSRLIQATVVFRNEPF